jgi:DNA-binding beta-propeller fold protein YncE
MGQGRWLRHSAALACAHILLGCGSPGTTPGIYDASTAQDSSTAPPPSDSGAPPPEIEERRSFLEPRAGGRYVYVSNPARDTVAVIDSTTLGIESVEVGRRPGALLTVEGRDEAIVLNTGSNTASILRTSAGRTVVSHVQSFQGANAIAVAPDGAHAVIYLDSAAEGATSTGGSFQDIVVLTLAPGMDRAVRLTVGFRPVNVLFARDGSAAFIVTEDGISILRFAEITGPSIVPNVSLSDLRVGEGPGDTDAGVTDAGIDAGGAGDDAGLDASASDASDASASDGSASDASATDVALVDPREAPTDVSITPDGRYAIARNEGSRILRLVDLRARTISRIDAGGDITDLDLSADGTFAIAVLREQSRVLRVAVPGGFTDPASVRRTDLRGEVFGSVSLAPDGRRALLFTTALDARRLLVMDLAGSDGTIALTLRKTVRAVAYAPDSRTALVLHRVSTGDPNERGIPLQTMLDRTPGYSMVEPTARFVKLQLTRADLGPFAIVPGGSHAFLLQRDDMRAIADVDRVDLRSFVVTTTNLGSPPSSVGAVPAARRVFVGQQHPEGRISFIDWESGALQSVTGFELNARIVM